MIFIEFPIIFHWEEMITYSGKIAVVVTLCLLSAFAQNLCLESSNYGVGLGLCKCPPMRVLVDGQCQSCIVPHCLLCSLQNINECDVCEPGFTLDMLSRSLCLEQKNSGMVCTQKSCQCSSYEVYKDGKCMSCSVRNCLLCSINEPTQCDICETGYTLDELTKIQCKAAVNSTIRCVASECLCSPYQTNINGVCLDCAVPRCRLCSTLNNFECDVCERGYVLDQFTQSKCVLAVSMAVNCTINSCTCGPLQVNVQGTCRDCGVLNCELCAIGNDQECDICVDGYVLDALTKTKCLKSAPSILSCSQNSCQCAPYQSKLNGQCLNCQIPNCQLCSWENPYECDVCQKGYLLDALSKTACVKAEGQAVSCKMLTGICSCEPNQIKFNGQCLTCDVDHCLLCSVSDSNECDICQPMYSYNPSTKKCDAPSCPQENNIWLIDHCECDKSIAFINNLGECQLIDNIKKLSLALGISIPILIISLAVVILINVSLGKRVDVINKKFVEVQDKISPESVAEKNKYDNSEIFR